MIAWVLLANLAGAQEESPCPLEVERYLEAVQEEGLEQAYLCLITTDAFRTPLVQRIRTFPPDAEEDNGLTRALALHLAARSDEPFDTAEVRLLNPADRRLLADAIKARRGRRSPSAEHEAIFSKQPWYNPRDRFTNNMLNEVERANVAMANRPPPADAAASEPASPKQVVPEQAPAQQPPQTPAPEQCGCASSSATHGPLWLLLLLAIGRRRR